MPHSPSVHISGASLENSTGLKGCKNGMYDGAIVDASTIRLGLSWGYSLAVACYRLRTEVSGSLGQVNIEWDDISVSNVLQHTVVKSPIE